MEFDDLRIRQLLNRVRFSRGARFVALDIVSRQEYTIARYDLAGFKVGNVSNDDFLWNRSRSQKKFLAPLNMPVL